LSEVDLKLWEGVCENDLGLGVLRREGSLCGLMNVLGSDVDVMVLKIGERRRLATTTDL
jgi:hypothetical protein